VECFPGGGFVSPKVEKPSVWQNATLFAVFPESRHFLLVTY
jgi:hypothetical protein